MEKTKPFAQGAFSADLDTMSREGLAVLLAVVMNQQGLSEVRVSFEDILATCGKMLRSRTASHGFTITLGAPSGAVKELADLAIAEVQAEHAASEAGETKH